MRVKKPNWTNGPHDLNSYVMLLVLIGPIKVNHGLKSMFRRYKEKSLVMDCAYNKKKSHVLV